MLDSAERGHNRFMAQRINELAALVSVVAGVFTLTDLALCVPLAIMRRSAEKRRFNRHVEQLKAAAATMARETTGQTAATPVPATT